MERFLTYQELLELYLMKFDRAVAELRRSLANPNPVTVVFQADGRMAELQSIVDDINTLKSVQIIINE